ncbi:MAG: peptidase M16 [Candidatus Muiribacterium halophilum]|uniref:Peptidase M16 n=1 Tax=Muiribacterium halophilum TaxID=2053465 RepID=A0A2N5ZLN0_MUIH1|nr:MAG: peptidase M16 [Candidatus Muirbacterium halophilum]
MIDIKKIDDLTLVYEKIPHVKSVSIGVWVKTGTAFEKGFPDGISHYVEHMVFKGTEKRSARDIAEQLDSVGGYLNAFSSKEYTCFYVRIISEHIELAVDVLADIVINSKFDSKEMEKEKEVIIEEIGMYEDNPDELANDMINEVYWEDHPLGSNILGTIESVRKTKRKDLVEYVRKNYTRKNTIISVAGNFEEPELINMVERKFRNMKKGNSAQIEIPEHKKIGVPKFIKKDIKQTHLCLALTGPCQVSDDKYAFGILSSILGGGMSSRLFQEIRERFGFVYTIYSYTQAHKNSGMSVVYYACNPVNTQKVAELVMKELKGIIKSGVLEKELKRGKQQLKGNIILSLESTSARMRRLASSLIYYDRIIALDDVVKNIDDVNMKSIRYTASKYLDFNNITGVAVGPEEFDFSNIGS